MDQTTAMVLAILAAAVSTAGNVLQAIRGYKKDRAKDERDGEDEEARQKTERRSEEVKAAQREFDYLEKRYRGVIEQQERRLTAIDARLVEQQAAEMKCREDLAGARAAITHLNGQVAEMQRRLATLEGTAQ